MANYITRLRIELQETTTPHGIGATRYKVWQCFPGSAGIGEVKIAQGVKQSSVYKDALLYLMMVLISVAPEQYVSNLLLQIHPHRPALGMNMSNKPSHAGDKRMTVIEDEEMDIPPSTRSI
ncbi:hypothetical protein LTR05_006340 [Lithohypha guttulata]|uniref:Uncharacterized protein n=1 Tax=Lithohypha guttulata TaxID=1690604 RepID=A0AAN7SXQ7_9EURO|nr:hypothetical protein LTR05_006340 [Lithohypha guttulata]